MAAIAFMVPPVILEPVGLYAAVGVLARRAQPGEVLDARQLCREPVLRGAQLPLVERDRRCVGAGREALLRRRGLREPLPGEAQGGEDLEEVGAVEQHAFAIAAQPLLREVQGELAELLARRGKLLLPGLRQAGLRGPRQRLAQLLAPRRQRRAAPRRDLAAEKIQALDPRRTLVQRVELLVAKPGLRQVFARISISAVHLHRERVGREALL